MRSRQSGIWLRVALVGGSVLLLLAASKAHGRQIRLERQLAGHWDVSFMDPAPPWSRRSDAGRAGMPAETGRG